MSRSFSLRACRALASLATCFGLAWAIADLSAVASPSERSVEAMRVVPSTPDLPGGFRVTLVSRTIEIDRQAASVWAISGAGAAEALAASIRAHWAAARGNPVQQAERAGWVIVWMHAPDRVEMVQLRDQDGQANGYLSLWQPSTAAPRAHSTSARWLPRSVESLSEVTSSEAGTRVTTWIGSSIERPGVLLDQVGEIARSRGLRAITQTPAGMESVSGPSRPHWMTSGAQVMRFLGKSLEFVVTVDAGTGRTAIVAHLMEAVR